MESGEYYKLVSTGLLWIGKYYPPQTIESDFVLQTGESDFARPRQKFDLGSTDIMFCPSLP